MDKIAKLAPFERNGAVRVVVESPGGAVVKLKYDPDLGMMTLGRPLPLGLQYPCDWGFVPGTKAEDGDPVDAFVVADAPTFPGVVISCRLLGVIEAEQDDPQHKKRVRNDRLVALPVTAPRRELLRRYDDLPERVRAELEAFLLAAVQFEGKNVVILGRAGPDAAKALIERSRIPGSRVGSRARR